MRVRSGCHSFLDHTAKVWRLSFAAMEAKALEAAFHKFLIIIADVARSAFNSYILIIPSGFLPRCARNSNATAKLNQRKKTQERRATKRKRSEQGVGHCGLEADSATALCAKRF